jgi:hypothetical protein
VRGSGAAHLRARVSDTFILGNVGQVRRFIAWLGGLTFDKPWKVTVERIEPGSSIEQECVLRGIEKAIADFTGHDKEEVHEMMLARHYGVEEVDLGNGQKLVRPRRTRTGTNPLKHPEMREHMRFVEAVGRELGAIR